MALSLQDHYNELLEILRDNRHCWEQEVLNFYPSSIESAPTEWMEVLSGLSLDQLWLMDSKQDFSFLTVKKMRQCFEKLEELTTLPSKVIPSSHEFNQADAFFGVKEKKRHEIQQIAPVIKELKDKVNFKRMIDIGGGQGHLGRVVSKHFGVETLSVDRDPYLLQQGRKNVDRLKHRVLPEGAAPIDFEQINIQEGEPAPLCFNQDSFILGLHTCGDLAWHLMDYTDQAQSKGLLSFGCCYNKMRVTKDGFAHFAPTELALDQNTLTLATRGHRSGSRKAFDLKLQVKRHRYALHLFHFHERDIKRFYPMGETHPREYQGAFSDYALPRLEAYQINATKEELEEFYEKDWVVALYKKMICANLIRWQFGRALEMYILLDRAIKLSKMGLEVELATYFEEQVSPRNIGILAIRK